MSYIKSARAYALVTGGSLGIGLELSKLFAADSYNLIIVSKPEEELKAGKEQLSAMFPNIDIITIQKDLSVQGSALEVYNQVKNLDVEVDIVVNNAGFGTWGFFNGIPVEKELAMINLNVVTLFHLTRLFAADMVKKNNGRILNVSSTAGMNAQPEFSAYAATKAFSLHYSEAINFELKNSGSSVTITTLCPPPVRTGFQKSSGMEKSSMFKKSIAMDAPDVAQKAYQALFKGKSMIIPDAKGVVAMKIFKLLPKEKRMKTLINIAK
jgi:short-subunit dehydrogenase